MRQKPERLRQIARQLRGETKREPNPVLREVIEILAQAYEEVAEAREAATLSPENNPCTADSTCHSSPPSKN
jgi:hypothetical protein